MSSAAAGQPPSPSFTDHSPSCICPARVSVYSWQWSITNSPNILAYTMALRMSSALCTHEPSSVMAFTPSFASDPIGASFSPLLPSVMHPLW